MDAKQYVENMFERVENEHAEEFTHLNRTFVSQDVDIKNKVLLVNLINQYEFMLTNELREAIIKTIEENNPSYGELKLIMQVVYNECFNIIAKSKQHP